MDQQQKRLAIRKRLLEDFEFYAQHCLKIRTKDGDVRPLLLNRAQKRLLALVNEQMATRGYVRIIIPKARQLGLSTMVGAWMYWWTSQRKAQKALVVTHHADSTKALFAMTKRFHINVPQELQPHTKYDNRNEYVFDVLDSSYAVGTAGGTGVSRGETITVAHLSELAWWPPGAANENLAGILQAVPEREGTAIFIESTSNGASGPFYDMTMGAIEGDNGYEVCFLPWYLDDDYATEPPEEMAYTKEEQDYAEKWGLDQAQMYFRRRKINQTGSEQFQQEYPAFLEESFLSTGRPVFDLNILHERKLNSRPILHRMGLFGEKWVEDPHGELFCYYPLDPGEVYYIGADVAMGLKYDKKSDFSVAQVLDGKKRQVGVWRAKIHPRDYADVLYHLGMYYNAARIAVEINNHGLLTGDRLYKDLMYPNFYTEVIEDKISDRDTINLGFRTTMKTKPLIIDGLRSTIKDREMELNDLTTISELRTFVATETGKLEADSGNHDDCVMSLAIANHIHEGLWNPVDNVEAFYLEAL